MADMWREEPEEVQNEYRDKAKRLRTEPQTVELTVKQVKKRRERLENALAIAVENLGE